MFAIYKKELKQYFHSMIGFIFLAFFLAIIGIYTRANNFYGGVGNFELTLSSSNFLFVILIPILTMRVLAEEKHQKTDQLLFTSPVSINKIVAGKYLALITLFGIGVLVIGLYPLILSHYGTDVQLSMCYSAVIGFFLLGAAYIAVGTFISSLTESQPIAAVVSFIVLLLSYLMTSISGAIPTDKTSQAVILSVLWLIVAGILYYMMNNPIVSIVAAVLGEVAVWVVYALKSSVYEGILTDALNCVALSSRFEDFTVGVLKYDVIVYYLSVAFLFVFLTIQALKRNRQFKSGAYNTILTVIVIALVVIANLVFNKLELSTDLTSDSLFTLSDETKEVLEGTEDKITIYYMVEKGSEQDYIQRVVNQYKKVADNVSVVTKDPVVYPNFTKQYVDDDVSNNDVVVVDETTGAAKYISNGDMYYQDNYSYYSSGSSQYYLDVEGRITSAIQYVLSDEVQKIYVTTGHDEHSFSDSLTTTLDKMNLDVEEISLVTEKKVPEDCTLLILYGPAGDLRDSEKEIVEEYLEDGGDAIIMPTYTDQDTPNLDEILDTYGISIDKGIIYEGAGHYETYLNWIIPSIDNSQEVMSKFEDNDYTIIADAQSLRLADASSLRSSLSVTELLTTSKKALLKVDPTSGKTEKEKGDLDGPFTVGAYAKETVEDGETRLVVFSTADVQEVLLQNTISALSGSGSADGTTAIEAKNLSYSGVTMNVGAQIFWTILLIIIVPLCLLITGFGIWFVRRRK